MLPKAQRSGEGRLKRQLSLVKKMVVGTLVAQRQKARVAHRSRRAGQEALVTNV